jgi:hypothetical protein
MKITICGSIHFAEEIVKAAKELEKNGHEVEMPASIKDFGVNNFEEADVLKNDREKYIKEIKPEYTRGHFNKVLNGDAILVINIEKNGIENYIGGATFSEIMLAFHGNKKIYFLNPIPDEPKTFIDELESVSPIILNGNLGEIDGNTS